MADETPAGNGSIPILKIVAGMGAALLIAFLSWLGATVARHSEQLAGIEAQMGNLSAAITTVTADRYTGAQAALDREAERRLADRMQDQIDALDSRLRAVERGNYGETP